MESRFGIHNLLIAFSNDATVDICLCKCFWAISKKKEGNAEIPRYSQKQANNNLQKTRGFIPSMSREKNIICIYCWFLPFVYWELILDASVVPLLALALQWVFPTFLVMRALPGHCMRLNLKDFPLPLHQRPLHQWLEICSLFYRTWCHLMSNWTGSVCKKEGRWRFELSSFRCIRPQITEGTQGG